MVSEYGRFHSEGTIYPVAIIFKPSHTKSYTQPKPRPYHMTNFTRFDESEATFEMSCDILAHRLTKNTP